MKDYIELLIDLFGGDISANVPSPVNKCLQNIDENYIRL